MSQSLLKSPLDPSLLVLGEDELAFFKAQTGIHDVEQLRQHILRIQKEAYEISPYPCIHRFQFTKISITKSPSYKHVLQMGKIRDNAILLDLGCCFGQDIRALIADGYPSQNIIALDVNRALWNLGLQLFNSTPSTFPVLFIEGDIFDSAILDTRTSIPPSLEVPSLLSQGNSLTALRNHISVIHIAMVFHLFQEDEQLELAQRLGALLSPLPGSIIFGFHAGLPVPGIRSKSISGLRVFCHSPDSWRSLWETKVFEKGSVEVDVRLVPSEALAWINEEPSEFNAEDTNEPWQAFEWLEWSVKRL